MKKSFVYVGLMGATGGDFFVKVGKTDHPEKRFKTYATHCPGGLSSMHAVEVNGSAAALAGEARMLAALRAMESVRRMGGEWFSVSADRLDDVFSELCRFGEPQRIHVARGCRTYDW